MGILVYQLMTANPPRAWRKKVLPKYQNRAFVLPTIAPNPRQHCMKKVLQKYQKKVWQKYQKLIPYH